MGVRRSTVHSPLFLRSAGSLLQPTHRHRDRGGGDEGVPGDVESELGGLVVAVEPAAGAAAGVGLELQRVTSDDPVDHRHHGHAEHNQPKARNSVPNAACMQPAILSARSK